ncbi:MAG: YdcF family protein [Rectinema subterraneum]|uniref:YdcF family protein n=1 Tax=Rectinema subterraneum TaxID=2653714 RepID=UPI003C7A3792
MSTIIFYISKILRPVVASPLFIAIIFSAIALFLLRARSRLQRVIKALALVFLLLVAVISEPFVATGLARLWEYPRSDLDDCLSKGPYAAIVVLGGSLDPVTSKPGAIEGNDSFERLVAAAELYRKGAAPIVIASGGTGSLSYADRREAPFMAEFLELMGVRRNAVVIEDKSRNTFENAVYSKAYLEKREGSGNAKPGRIILVTSAWHQRRASAIFRKAGIDFYPYSVDSLVAPFMLPSDLFPDSWALTRSTRILIEMAGFVAYRIMGRL